MMDADLTWHCHVCGEKRPDRAISVHKIDRTSEAFGDVKWTENVRYCNDREPCARLAGLGLAELGARLAREARVAPEAPKPWWKRLLG